MTVYHETVSSEYLERALYLEAERLAFLPSALDQAKFDTEREVVKNERRQDYDNVPYGFVEETLLARVFPKGHPYSWSVIGSMKDLNAASLDDLRSFFAEFYHPANATLCLAGEFDPARAKELIARYFGPLSAGPRRRPCRLSQPLPTLRTSSSPTRSTCRAFTGRGPRWPTTIPIRPHSTCWRPCSRAARPRGCTRPWFATCAGQRCHSR